MRLRLHPVPRLLLARPPHQLRQEVGLADFQVTPTYFFLFYLYAY
jgi:hypothetical protein